MPLFFRKRKPSEDAKKRLEYQLCLSKEAGADDVLDLSSCELTEIPSSAFSISKVLQKKAFILSDNELKSLVPKGCSVSHLITVKLLDLHNNKLTSLPDDIGQLTSLQVLNVERNHLKGLPRSIGDLRSLKTLNLKGNCLNELPAFVGQLKSLKTLDLSENNIRELPKELANARCLEKLVLDTAQMTYPHSSVCAAGTEAIQRFLCAELGVEYCLPSEYQPPPEAKAEENISMDELDLTWQSNYLEYEKRKDQKHHEKLMFEQELEVKQRQHAHLVCLNNSHKEGILLSVKEEQERLERGLTMQQAALDVARQRTLQKVREAEDNISSRISSLLLDNSRQLKTAEVLQALEEDRIRVEHLTAVTQEEANSLREKEVALAMKKMLSEGFSMRLLQEANEGRRQSLVTATYQSMENQDRKLEQVLSLQQLDHSKAVAEILQEEEMQKAAFEALQLQKDCVHGYIRNQIKLIEAELMQLTKLEVKRRDLDAENLQFVMADQRTALSDMLQVLLKQKDQREKELKQVLVELEQKSEANFTNYWMIQYQRLLDSKPLAIAMEEAGVDRELVSLLSKLSAEHYLPILAHHRVTADTLKHMTASDLSKIGINEVGIQKALLNWAKTQVSMPTKVALPAEPEEEQQEEEEEEEEVAGPSQPTAPSPDYTPPRTPSAPSPIDSPASSECVVCMEQGSQVIFLPCGHVCCCHRCSDALQTCPLCRADIEQRVRLYHG
ncbi:E3 ubiquitin-protein ligase LRSAM1 [Engraulis encrasicolus]|uniref:E3 ubiquitin-protein ligase LRSAM1 n=1 Tax=Engraulis encrasicolus TaxID=184585 RepID=UPI002FCF85D2